MARRTHPYARVNHVRGRKRRDSERKGKRKSERIVALLSTNRWQTCVHQRAAYRPPLTCQPPPRPYCKIWIAEVYNTPPRRQPSSPPFPTPTTSLEALPPGIGNTRVTFSTFLLFLPPRKFFSSSSILFPSVNFVLDVQAVVQLANFNIDRNDTNRVGSTLSLQGSSRIKETKKER